MNLFIVVFVCMAALFACECLFPLYPRDLRKNLNNTLVNVAFGVVSVGLVEIVYKFLAQLIHFPRINLFDISELGFAAEFIICLLLLDFVSWCWHWLNHNIPLLWRSHAAHHSDLYLNTSSSIRFHFFELFPGFLIRIAVGQVIGFSVAALALFQAVYMIFNAFEHSNLNIPKKLDLVLSYVFVTPRIHHLHHSYLVQDHHSNLGTVFSFWDRIFGSFRRNPTDRVHYGIAPKQRELKLLEVFLLPVTGSKKL